MKIFKKIKKWFTPRPLYEVGEEIIISDPFNELYGKNGYISSRDWSSIPKRDYFKYYLFRVVPNPILYTIRFLDEKEQEWYMRYWFYRDYKWDQLSKPFNPVDYYKDQPGDLDSDI